MAVNNRTKKNRPWPKRDAAGKPTRDPKGRAEPWMHPSQRAVPGSPPGSIPYTVTEHIDNERGNHKGLLTDRQLDVDMAIRVLKLSVESAVRQALSDVRSAIKQTNIGYLNQNVLEDRDGASSFKAVFDDLHLALHKLEEMS